MRRSFFFLLFFTLVIRIAVVCAADTGEPGENELYAKAAVLMDGESGRILYGKDENSRMPMASTTKIMTCILALEKGDPEMVCSFSDRAAASPKVRLGAQEGSSFLLEDLLYSLMLESHNDTAVAVAEAVGGSVEGFVQMMNEKADMLGLEDTSFVTPNGLDADGHYTTAADLARLLRYCIKESPKREEFLTVTARGSYTFSDTEKSCCYTVNNHNAFLNMMEGALTGKTGFTGKAGYCYVGALQRDGRLFIVSLLACGWPSNRSYKWSDTRLLMRYGLENYQIREISVQVKLPETAAVENGVYDWTAGESSAAVALQTDSPKKVRYLLKEGETVETKVVLSKSLTAPVKEGETVGEVQYWIGETCIEEYQVRTAGSVEKKDWEWYVRQAAACFLL